MEVVTVRPATPDDAAACAAIYAPYVSDTAITFESVPPDTSEMAGRIAAAQREHAWLVAESGPKEDPYTRRIVGYAYAGPYSPRDAYRWSVEVSAYLALDERGRGTGRLLYEQLLSTLRERGFHSAIARIALPNEASIRLHTRFGFVESGLYREIGYKLGRWHDVATMQLPLQTPGTSPLREG